MLKIMSAIAAAALIAGAIVVLPGMSNDVKAGIPEAAPKGDRLVTEAVPACIQRGWPYFDQACPQRAGQAKPVRLVTTDRF